MCHTVDQLDDMEQGMPDASQRTSLAAGSGARYSRSISNSSASSSASGSSSSSRRQSETNGVQFDGRASGEGTRERAGFGARVQALTGAMQNVLEAARPAEEPYDTAASSAERHR